MCRNVKSLQALGIAWRTIEYPRVSVKRASTQGSGSHTWAEDGSGLSCLWTWCMDSRVVLYGGRPRSRPESEPGSQACRRLLNVSLLCKCSPPLLRCCRRRLPPRATRNRASGAMVRQYGPLAIKPAAPAAAMSLRDTMGPVRDTARMLQLSNPTLQEVLRARSRGWRWPGQVTRG